MYVLLLGGLKISKKIASGKMETDMIKTSKKNQLKKGLWKLKKYLIEIYSFKILKF